MKKIYYITFTLIFIGCGGGSQDKAMVPQEEVEFLTNGVKGEVTFQKSKYDPTPETITIKSAIANKCEAVLLNPETINLDKNKFFYEYNFSIAFKDVPCYTDKVYINYEKKILDAKEEKTLTILNPQYNQILVYHKEGDDPLYKYQWHLKNTGQDFGVIKAKKGEDINVEDVWKSGITGKGVVVGVIDSGVDMFHPDLKDNIDWEDSYNYLNATHNTTPIGNIPFDYANYSYDSSHGTAVAGIIAARGWNGIGTRGVAPNAKIAALNALVVLEGQVSEDGYNDAITPSIQTVRMLDALVRNLDNIDIYNNSWGGNTTTLIDDYILKDTIDYDVQSNYGVKFGRNGLGAIYVKSAGNDGNSSNANFEQLQTSGNWIVVGAVGADGIITSYSTLGSAVLISAPGGGINPNFIKQNKLQIVTTDLAGDKRGFDRVDKYATIMPHFDVKGNENYDYTYFMNGTSAAAPIVSGVIALMLEANPNLTYRDVKIILAKSARKNDVNDSDWQINAAGLHFNYKYGFGVVDAKAAVEMAKSWKSVGGFTDLKTVSKTTFFKVNSTNGELNVTFPIEENITIEDTKLYLTLDNNSSTELITYQNSGSGDNISTYLLYSGYNNINISTDNNITVTISDKNNNIVYNKEFNGTLSDDFVVVSTGYYKVEIKNDSNEIANWEYTITTLKRNSSANKIMISLISPSNTKSILVKAPNSLDVNEQYKDVRLLSTHFMEESSKGKWILNIKSIDGGEFSLKKAKLEITGH